MKLLEENKRKSLQPQGGEKCLDRQNFQAPVIKGPKKNDKLDFRIRQLFRDIFKSDKVSHILRENISKTYVR